jgi:hypothetical protein
MQHGHQKLVRCCLCEWSAASILAGDNHSGVVGIAAQHSCRWHTQETEHQQTPAAVNDSTVQLLACWCKNASW